VAALIWPDAPPILAVAIPAGISFYTFHQAVFLVHAFNRQSEVLDFFKKATGAVGALDTFLRYAAFVAFFPQLVIGPITYMSELGPQLDRRGLGLLRNRNIQVGVTLVVVGLFKKIVIADRLAPMVDRVYYYLHWHSAISAPQALLAVVGYFFQLYFDFSGYSDIALGIARLFGLRLPINFDSPLRATGIVDFYRRWHMTLTRVIVLFVFTPLSLWGTRAAVRRGLKGWQGRLIAVWLPYLLNFQIIALWHAAKFTFVAFGLVHGLWYIAESEVRRSKMFRRFASATSERLRTLGGMALTVAPLSLTFALFRSDDLFTFKLLIKGFVVPFRTSLTNDGHVDATVWPILAAVAAIVYLLPNAYEVLRRFNPGFHTFKNRSVTPPALRVEWKPNVVWGLLVAAMAVAVLASLNVPSPFLYGRF
jgi:D-alanyl-lipoteichoic acid acyltransferase DltB (MBOAT superfamily)